MKKNKKSPKNLKENLMGNKGKKSSKTIDFSNLNIKNSHLKFLKESIQKYKNAKILKLNGNQLTHVGIA